MTSERHCGAAYADGSWFAIAWPLNVSWLRLFCFRPKYPTVLGFSDHFSDSSCWLSPNKKVPACCSVSFYSLYALAPCGLVGEEEEQRSLSICAVPGPLLGAFHSLSTKATRQHHAGGVITFTAVEKTDSEKRSNTLCWWRPGWNPN